MDQIEVSNYNTTGLLGINSLIMFDGHSTFVNNSGIYGGGIALYGSSQLLLSQNTNISFVNIMPVSQVEESLYHNFLI